jgi:hypothetical protein
VCACVYACGVCVRVRCVEGGRVAVMAVHRQAHAAARADGLRRAAHLYSLNWAFFQGFLPSL